MRKLLAALLLATGLSGSLHADLTSGTPDLRGTPGLPGDFAATRLAHVPAPAEVIGFVPGERHPRNDQIESYLRALADASDRVKLEVTGHTHDGRPLLLAYFARPDRLENLEELRAGRKSASRAGDGPPVVWLGYSVHGNEASGASAAMLTAWYLAASEDEEALAWLDDMVIVMEPVLNPDGLDRFAHWVNMHRGQHPSADPVDREHREAWPSGRTNYYWFDLNRDWLPLVHPESRARMAHYHKWRPHVLTDHHEMGHLSSYFFQPGVPERNNPMTPQRNYDLTGQLAVFHGAALDAAGEPHYTKESFDDYYVGKGSTYPDLTGGVGILFEQGSSRGHVMETPWGERTFTDAVANQVRTSLSTLRGSHSIGTELIDYQAEFFRQQREQARADRLAGWLLADGGDPVRAQALLEILLQHDLDIRPVTGAVVVDGREYAPGSAWAIPADQDHYLLLRSIFDEPTDLPMDTFYDVSAWPMHRAFDLPLAEVDRLPATRAPLAEVRSEVHSDENGAELPERATAWLVAWNQYGAPALLGDLLREGWRVAAATRPLTAATHAGERELVRGSLVIHPETQQGSPAELRERLTTLAERHQVQVLAAERGLTAAGPDLGSRTLPMLAPPRVAMLTGDALRPNHAGYIWHWFDTRLGQPLTRIDWHRLADTYGAGRRHALDGYSHLILPDGDYGKLPRAVGQMLERFVRDGGHLIAVRSASRWVEALDLDWDFDEEEPRNETLAPRPYGDHVQDFARELIGGSALRLHLDITHPLAFGYTEPEITAFRRGAHRLRADPNPYVTPARYPENALVAGYLSERNRDLLAGTPALAASRVGNGMVIRMADDYLFRGYWLGTERLFANALFFSQLIRETRLPEEN